MSELILHRDEKIKLRADAHHITFSVLLGASGLTEAVVKEIDRALTSHGLIKVHVPGDDREERTKIYEELADSLGCARIQAIGKTLVLYRPIPEKEEEPAKKPASSPRKKRSPKKGAPKPPTHAKKTRAGTAKRTTKKKALSS